ncbi:MAG: hypothetical protein IT365_12825 [Candidatus Hydrogenedentes bacterium]|nr:hypothetical protein [Candidatus Hydrogenedentota bacterium]
MTQKRQAPAEIRSSIRLAAKAESKFQNELFVAVLTSALSRIPGPRWEEHED